MASYRLLHVWDGDDDGFVLGSFDDNGYRLADYKLPVSGFEGLVSGLEKLVSDG